VTRWWRRGWPLALTRERNFALTVAKPRFPWKHLWKQSQWKQACCCNSKNRVFGGLMAGIDATPVA
jgi:hypothetical protein